MSPNDQRPAAWPPGTAVKYRQAGPRMTQRRYQQPATRHLVITKVA